MLIRTIMKINQKSKIKKFVKFRKNYQNLKLKIKKNL